MALGGRNMALGGRDMALGGGTCCLGWLGGSVIACQEAKETGVQPDQCPGKKDLQERLASILKRENVMGGQLAMDHGGPQGVTRGPAGHESGGETPREKNKHS